MTREWNPSDLPNLKMWYDATDSSAVIKNKDGTVKAIIDKSTRKGRIHCWFRRLFSRKKG